ncbi:hypothetical protein J6590_067702 [Homalodisca vitripennis]|nr:hypothetical protein J6590_067702 [Homalodisca vitripennis]
MERLHDSRYYCKKSNPVFPMKQNEARSFWRQSPTILTPKHRAGSSRERAASFDYKTPTTKTLRRPRTTEAGREESKKPNSRYLET